MESGKPWLFATIPSRVELEGFDLDLVDIEVAALVVAEVVKVVMELMEVMEAVIWPEVEVG